MEYRLTSPAGDGEKTGRLKKIEDYHIGTITDGGRTLYDRDVDGDIDQPAVKALVAARTAALKINNFGTKVGEMNWALEEMMRWYDAHTETEHDIEDRGRLHGALSALIEMARELQDKITAPDA
jgi:hypothetical protein